MEVARPLPWVIDAWAVHDGKVFASRRPLDSIDADVTVFLSVPDLEAVPVGRISTALRAVRSGFQAGLRDAEGNEIAFSNLGQLRALVSRAYLAAGLGPEAPGAVAGPLPAPDRGPGAGSALLESMAPEYPPWSDEMHFPGHAPERLDQAVALYAAAVILEFEELFFDDLAPSLIRGFVQFVEAVLGSGIVPDILFTEAVDWMRDEADIHGLARSIPSATWPAALGQAAENRGWGGLAHACSRIVDAFPPGAVTTLGTNYGHLVIHRPGDLVSLESRGLLAVVPGPRPTAYRRWPCSRLAELALIPQIDSRFWEGARTTLDLAPATLAVALRSPRRLGVLDGEVSPAGAAFARLRPRLDAPSCPKAAESALHGFIDACLAGRASGEPDPEPPSRPSTDGLRAKRSSAPQSDEVRRHDGPSALA